jgi:hypothetical protein
MKRFDRKTAESIRHGLRVFAEDINLRTRGLLEEETLEQLDLEIPYSLGNKKLKLIRNLNF